MPPLLTIGIATRNGASRLPALLETLLPQVGGDGSAAVVVCDDGSTDGTPRTLAAWGRGHPGFPLTAIRQEPAGPGPARNRILDAVPTGHVWFVDDDDELPPGAVARVMRTLREARPRVLGFRYRTEPLPEWPPVAESRPEAYSAREALPFWDVHTWSAAYSAEFLRKAAIRFPALPIAEDAAFAFQAVCAAGEVLFLDEPLYRYAVRPGSLCGADSAGVRLQAFSSVSDLLDSLAAAHPALRAALLYRRHLLWVSLGAALRSIRRASGNSRAVRDGLRAVRERLAFFRASSSPLHLVPVDPFLPRFEHPLAESAWDAAVRWTSPHNP